MILERTGYNVVSVTNPDEAIRIFTGVGVDAVVFGGSIPTDERIELAQRFKSLDKSVPIIALSNTSGSQFASGIVDEQLESLGDPQLLLEALHRVLERNGNGSSPAGPTQDQENTKTFVRNS